MSNYIISDLVSRINLGAARRLRFIKINLNNVSLDILKILYKQGAIRSFIIKNNEILIYYKYFNSRIAIRISIISTPGNKIYWSLNKLSNKFNYHNFSGFYIISTQEGLFSSDYCLLQGRISGEVLIKVEV